VIHIKKGLFYPQHGRAETEYKVEGKVITISFLSGIVKCGGV
jgi:hypothetical protein